MYCGTCTCVAVMMIVDVVSSRVGCANDFAYSFSFFSAPLPLHHDRTSFSPFLSLSLSLWLSLCSSSFSFSLLFFLHVCEFVRVYGQWRPWTNDHVHIAVVTAVQMREKERNALNYHYCFAALLSFVSFFPFSCALSSFFVFSWCMCTYAFTVGRRCR